LEEKKKRGKNSRYRPEKARALPKLGQLKRKKKKGKTRGGVPLMRRPPEKKKREKAVINTTEGTGKGEHKKNKRVWKEGDRHLLL